MKIFLASLAFPFGACIIGYLRVRALAPEWPPPHAPPLPATPLWASTALILAASTSVHWSLLAVRTDRVRQLRAAVVTTLCLGCAFMVSQCLAWEKLLKIHEIPELELFSFTFYMLTGLHGLHVVAGLFLQTWVTVKTFSGCYWSYHHFGILYSVMYWHFLDAVWIVLFIVLLAGT